MNLMRAVVREVMDGKHTPLRPRHKQYRYEAPMFKRGGVHAQSTVLFCCVMHALA